MHRGPDQPQQSREEEVNIVGGDAEVEHAAVERMQDLGLRLEHRH
jgi:hypothetical protein